MKPVPCGSCEAPVIWTVTSKGNPMPVVAEPHPKGNILLTADDPPHAIYLSKDGVAQAQADGLTLYLSHFADCPHADFHRKRKPAAAAEKG